jgi:hypothetical protein
MVLSSVTGYNKAIKYIANDKNRAYNQCYLMIYYCIMNNIIFNTCYFDINNICYNIQ